MDARLLKYRSGGGQCITNKAKALDYFHHKNDNVVMSVVEIDGVVVGMLRDELVRCEEALSAIDKAIADLPTGSLGVRRKLHKGKKYEYQYLKFREGGKVINQHVPDSAVKELRDRLELRKRYASEALVYEKRISYLKKLLKAKVDPGESQDDK
jgi:hypothetical protein